MTQQLEVRPERLIDVAGLLCELDLSLLADLAEHLLLDPHAEFLRQFLADMIEQEWDDDPPKAWN